MRYECPSCFMQWQDKAEPLNNIYHPLCIFCSLPHTQKELLNWQMDHIDHISLAHQTMVIRYFYRYVELELKTLKEQLYDLRRNDLYRDDGERKHV